MGPIKNNRQTNHTAVEQKRVVYSENCLNGREKFTLVKNHSSVQIVRRRGLQWRTKEGRGAEGVIRPGQHSEGRQKKGKKKKKEKGKKEKERKIKYGRSMQLQ